MPWMPPSGSTKTVIVGVLGGSSTRRVTGAEAVAPVGSSAWQWYIPAWSRATWVKATVGTGSVCSRRPFQNQVKTQTPQQQRPSCLLAGSPSACICPKVVLTEPSKLRAVQT
ncbi:TPA: hypothetical protein BOS_13532 [Bos taurus]|nr:TPA: hypothetical protein BOS_13532 [Bos taurus]